MNSLGIVKFGVCQSKIVFFFFGSLKLTCALSRSVVSDSLQPQGL